MGKRVAFLQKNSAQHQDTAPRSSRTLTVMHWLASAVAHEACPRWAWELGVSDFVVRLWGWKKRSFRKLSREMFNFFVIWQAENFCSSSCWSFLFLVRGPFFPPKLKTTGLREAELHWRLDVVCCRVWGATVQQFLSDGWRSFHLSVLFLLKRMQLKMMMLIIYLSWLGWFF